MGCSALLFQPSAIGLISTGGSSPHTVLRCFSHGEKVEQGAEGGQKIQVKTTAKEQAGRWLFFQGL